MAGQDAFLSETSAAHKTAEDLLCEAAAAAASRAGEPGEGSSSAGEAGAGAGAVAGADATPGADRPPATLSSVALTWFEPVLALTRRVTAYEVRPTALPHSAPSL